MEPSDDCYDPVTDTSRLEPLSEQDLKEASVIIDRFGMEIACKLWSKKWQQRLEGLELVRSEMESLKGNMNNSGAYVNNSTLLNNNNSFIGNDVKEHRLQYVKAFDLIFQKNVKDHIFQVFQTLLNLTLSFLVVFQFSNGPAAQKSSNLPTLDLVIPILVLKLGDNCQSAISSECVKACKSNPSSKLLFLNVLSFMHLVYVESYQDWPMPTDQLMPFLIYCLSSNHFEVRERTEEFVMDVYKNNRQVVRGFFPADENVKIKTAKNILYKHLLNKFDALDGSNSKSNISAAISSQAQQALPQKQKNVAPVAIAIKNDDRRQPRQPEPHTESTRKNGNVTLKQQNKTNIPKPKTNLSKFNVEDKFSPATKSVSGVIKISGDSGPNNKENKFIQQHSLHQKNDQRDNLNVQDHELYHDYDDRRF
ncbi:hypothetical protein HELRODRAFT_165989 [Helobdella robusta]|uniref:TOG domain-containing protein n=1 Tax=Helobdella robusta TaxID=6412 RepID=T1EXJ4_HELRO|nr:hypothetical protein HELRODRAFT_165989 [Helobdella robusta]ESN90331.1 hypothetical protein HELRODRAFT_165989 [Helobdella robusta]